MRRAAQAWLLFLTALIGLVEPRALASVCAMSGGMQSSCCCADACPKERPESEAALRRAACCEVQSADAWTATSIEPPVSVAELPCKPLDATWPVEVGLRSDGLRPHEPPRAVGPPTYLRCCVLLV